MPSKISFFRPKDFFINVHKTINVPYTTVFFLPIFFKFFFDGFFMSYINDHSVNKNFFMANKRIANAFIGFFSSSFNFFHSPSYSVLHLKGIGYKCYHSKTFNKLVFNSGFNHYSSFLVPQGVEVRMRKVFFILFSTFFSVKKFVNIVRIIRFPDPYRAKGFRYKNQRVKLKIGKQRL